MMLPPGRINGEGRAPRGPSARRRCVGGGPVPVNSAGTLINAGAAGNFSYCTGR